MIPGQAEPTDAQRAVFARMNREPSRSNAGAREPNPMPTRAQAYAAYSAACEHEGRATDDAEFDAWWQVRPQ